MHAFRQGSSNGNDKLHFQYCFSGHVRSFASNNDSVISEKKYFCSGIIITVAWFWRAGPLYEKQDGDTDLVFWLVLSLASHSRHEFLYT